MSDLSPTGPSQPTQAQAYETQGNPVTKEPAEIRAAAQNTAQNKDSTAVDQRIPQEQVGDASQAKPTALGRGIRGAGPGEEAKGLTSEDVGRHNELDGEQMYMPGEGKVADAVEGKELRGASGEQPGFESDLDRKKREQAPAREAIKESRKEKVDVGGVLGQTGGPANPVGKDKYPNTGDY